jgi:DNA-binding NarL/FixJ family response regulator
VTNETRIVIADDHPVFRQGLRQIIEMDAHFRIVDEAADGEAALAKLTALRPEIAVLDIEMPKLNGFALARQIRAARLPTEIIFLTMYKEEEFFNEALDLGVKGYLLKDSAVTDILACIRAVTQGQHYITPTISAYLINRQSRAVTLAKQRPGLDDLTPAERRILKLIAENKTSKEIAAELFVSYRTIENHRANICQKLELKGSHALIKFALEHKSQLR